MGYHGMGVLEAARMGIAIPFVPSSGTSDTAGVLYEPSGLVVERESDHTWVCLEMGYTPNYSHLKTG